MRRTTPLTAVAMLGLALLAPTTSASAAGETCRGEAATIVGTSRTLTGTEGRDVIVTGAATDVKALGGDDLVCVVPQGTNTNVLTVDAGAGADVVDTTSAELNFYYVDTDLGPGADTLEGGVTGDWVTTGDATGDTSEVDVVRTGAGGDAVTTSGGADVVDLGPGTDRLTLDGAGIAGGSITGGDDLDTFVMTLAAPGEHAFDLAAGTYRSGSASADLVSFEGLDLDARGARVRIAGTPGDDWVDVDAEGPAPSVVVADLLGGDDVLSFYRSDLAAGTRIDLGDGVDRLVAARERGSLGIDLTRDELRVKDDTYPAAGVEDANLIARRTSLAGDAQDNTLVSYACDTTITGGHGDDQLIWDEDYFFDSYTFKCDTSATVRGGPGRDSIYGSYGDDRLFGDGGRDTIRAEMGADLVRGGSGADEVRAGNGNDDVRGGGGADKLFGNEGRDFTDGGAGRDRCVAERKRACER